MRTQLAIILTLAMMATSIASGLPDVGVVGLPTGPERLTVGFFEMPADVEPGDDYNGAPVVRVDPSLAFLTVVTSEPLAFRAKVLLDDNVRYFEATPWINLIQFTPNDPRYPSMYGPQQIGAPVAWDTTLGSTSAVVCVTDTGVRSTHEDLAGRFGGGFNFVGGNTNVADDNGHGTHVTGTATATTNNGLGIAGIGQSTYKHAKVLNSAGSGTWDGVASGVRWCADNGGHVISMSLGGSGGATVLLDAINYAWGAGSAIVAAAGNSGPCSNCVLFPAAYANSIAVSCTTSSKALCSFSSTGPEVDLAAPGSSIDSTCYTSDTAYCLKSGTSMSTPHVAGSAALVKSANPTFTNVDIRSALENNAEDLGAAGTDTSFGKGLVRPDLALGGAPPPPPPPTQTSHVSAIAGSFAHTQNNKHNVRCDVTAVDQNNAALSGATVSLTWTKPSGATSAQTATTGGTGIASFSLNNQRVHGTYNCAVTNITLTGYTYDPAANVVSSANVVVT